MQLNTLKPLRIQPEREHQKQNYFHLDDWVSNLETESPNLVGTYLKKNFQKAGYAARGGRWAHYFKSHLLYSSRTVHSVYDKKQANIN